MRIAITTWCDWENAGTFFQLYGLYSFLKSKGHDVKVVNYKKRSPKDYISRGLFYFLSQPFSLLQQKLKRKRHSKEMAVLTKPYEKELRKRKTVFQEEFGKLEFTEPVETEEDFRKLNDEFDAFIVGSDQVWNASMLNRRYFLDYVEKGKIKASFGHSMGSGTVLPYQRKVFKKYLESFNYIAVREKKLADILNNELQQNVEHVLDPSMLVTKDEYLRLARLPEQFEENSYALCYFMPRNEQQKQVVENYAKQHNLKIVVMAMLLDDYKLKVGEMYVEAGPREFLGLIANAAVVFTSSFHCTIFSILFNKDLYVFGQKAATKTADINQRYVEQLATYGINRLIGWGQDISPEIQKPIDYEKVNAIFEARRNGSIHYLEQFA